MGRENSTNKYDIYYQKFDDKGNKLGETLIVRNPDYLTNLTTNEFTGIEVASFIR